MAKQEQIFLSVEDAARMLALTKWTVYGMCRDGVLTSVKVGRRVLLTPESVHAYKTDRLAQLEQGAQQLRQAGEPA